MKQSAAWLVTCAMGASVVLAFSAVIGGDTIEAVLNLGQQHLGHQPPIATAPSDRGRVAAHAESTGSSTVGAKSDAGTREPQRDPATPGPTAPQPDGVAQEPKDEPGREAQLHEPDRPEPAQHALPRKSEPLEPKIASETKTVQADREPVRPAEPARQMPRVEDAPPEAPARSKRPELPSSEQQALPKRPEPAQSKSNSDTQPAHAEREPAKLDEPTPPVTQAERAPPEAPASAEQQSQPSQRKLPEAKPNSAPESQPAHAERQPARQGEPPPPVTQAERAPPEAPASPEPQTVLREPAPPEAKAEPAPENPKIDTHEPSTREASTPAPAEILPTPEARAATPSEPSEPGATAITADSPNAAGDIKSGSTAAPVEATPRESSATLQRPATEVRPADTRKLRAAKRHKKSFKRKANRQKAYRRAYARARPADAGAWAAPPHYHQWGANPPGPRRCHIAYVPYGETWYRVRSCR